MMSSSVQALIKSTSTSNQQVKGRAFEGDAEAFQAELGKASSRAKKSEPADEPKPSKVSRSKKADKAKGRQGEAEDTPVEAVEAVEGKPVEPAAEEPVAVDEAEAVEPVDSEAKVEKPVAKADADAASLAVAVPGVVAPTDTPVVTEATPESETQATAAPVQAVAKAEPTEADPAATAAQKTVAAAAKGEFELPEELAAETEIAAAPQAKPELKTPEAESAPVTAPVAQQPPAEEKIVGTKASAKVDAPTSDLQQAAPKATYEAPALAKPQVVEAPPEVRFAQDNHDSIVKGVQTQLLPRGGTMTMRLDPPELGALNVILSIKDGIATASFQTSNDQATQMLSHSLSQLKTAMESTGITVDKIQVQQAPKNQDGQSSREDNQQRGQPGGDEMARQQEQQRKEMLRKLWRRLNVGSDPLDLVA
jgi:flagellar hook-length control protein FliK